MLDIDTVVLVNCKGEYVVRGWKETHTGREPTVDFTKDLNLATVFAKIYSTRKWIDTVKMQYKLQELPAYEERKVYLGEKE